MSKEAGRSLVWGVVRCHVCNRRKEEAFFQVVQAMLNLKGRPCPRAGMVQEDGGRWEQRKEKHSPDSRMRVSAYDFGGSVSIQTTASSSGESPIASQGSSEQHLPTLS